MSAQGTLFDFEPAATLTQSPDGGVDWERLDGLAFLYTATETGTATGIRFAATVADAQAWCSSQVSAGRMHGTRWAYMWTSASNYIRHHSGDGDTYATGRPRIDLRGCTDDGTWDERIAAAGVTNIDLRDLPALLRECGVEVVAQ